MDSSPMPTLTTSRLIARNTVLNLVGQLIPLIVAVFVVPPLIRHLGTDRFGVLTLAWVLVGYFSLFDLGLGRALSQLVAEALGSQRQNEISSLIRHTLGLTLGLGFIGSLIFAAISPWLINSILLIPLTLRSETLVAFRLLAISLPFVTMSAGLIGILQAFQRFDLLNYIKLPVGILAFAGPLLVLPFSSGLTGVILVLVILRALMCGALALTCYRIVAGLSDGAVRHSYSLGTLWRFASWMTVSNVVGPILVYLDRFIIGMFLSVAAVAYYATPYEAVTKLWIIPAAFAGVLFPAFATSFVQDRNQTVFLFTRGVKYVFLILFPVVFLIVSFAQSGLSLWLGSDFALHGSIPLQWLAAGVLLNSLGFIPFAFLQAIGRPDFTAKLHLIELPGYIALASYLVWTFGIDGAAVGWFIRVAVDTVALFLAARRYLPTSRTLCRQSVLVMGLTLVTLAIAATTQRTAIKISFALIILSGYFMVSWSAILDAPERAFVRRVLSFRTVTGSHPQ